MARLAPLSRASITTPIVQISLDVTTIREALETAAVAVDAGVDWLEAGTPLLLGEGLHAVAALRERFPDHPVVADLKTMDGGYLEAEMMAKAGADVVVVMARAHEATIRRVVDAGRDFGVQVMGDDLGTRDKAAAARRLEELGVDCVIHHTGFDERGLTGATPFDRLAEVVAATTLPVQAVGGLSIPQAIAAPSLGAPLVVLGAPLTIEPGAFRARADDLQGVLEEICSSVRDTPVVYPPVSMEQ